LTTQYLCDIIGGNFSMGQPVVCNLGTPERRRAPHKTENTKIAEPVAKNENQSNI
jgi:hypothetical protein